MTMEHIHTSSTNVLLRRIPEIVIVHQLIMLFVMEYLQIKILPRRRYIDNTMVTATALKDGWHGDTSRMYEEFGGVSVKAKKLIETTDLWH